MAAETTKNFWARVHEAQAILEEFPYVISLDVCEHGVTPGVTAQVTARMAAIQIVSKTHRLATAEEVTAHLAQQKAASAAIAAQDERARSDTRRRRR
jgi:hypothetical protein